MVRIGITIFIVIFLLYWWRDKIDFIATLNKYSPLATKNEPILEEPLIVGVDFLYYSLNDEVINKRGENPVVDLTKIQRIVSFLNFQNNNNIDIMVYVPKLNVSLSNGETEDSDSLSDFNNVILPAGMKAYMPRGKDFDATMLLKLLERDDNFWITFKPIGSYYKKEGENNKNLFTKSIRCRNLFTKEKLPQFQLACSLI